MKKVITKFYFDQARYLIGDDFGHKVFMEIDYKKGGYKLSGQMPDQLKMQIDIVATNLIKKKQNVNFSDRIEI